MTWRTAIASTAIVLAAAGANAGIAEFDTYQWEFTVEVDTGPLTGNTYIGDFTYSLPVERGGGEQPIVLDSLFFPFFGIFFDEATDVDFPDFPRARFDEFGKFTGIDFIAEFFNPPPRGEFNAGFGIFDNSFSYDLDFFDFNPESRGGPNPDDPTAGTGSVTYRLIPSPGAAAAFGLLALGATRRRR